MPSDDAEKQSVQLREGNAFEPNAISKIEFEMQGAISGAQAPGALRLFQLRRR